MRSVWCNYFSAVVNNIQYYTWVVTSGYLHIHILYYALQSFMVQPGADKVNRSAYVRLCPVSSYTEGHFWAKHLFTVRVKIMRLCATYYYYNIIYSTSAITFPYIFRSRAFDYILIARIKNIYFNCILYEYWVPIKTWFYYFEKYKIRRPIIK